MDYGGLDWVRMLLGVEEMRYRKRVEGTGKGRDAEG